ncbi:MAG: response regulator [Desulfobulbaceae bacterium]|nr:response regulator [Desulfobulbaceae bacterium]
MAGSGKIHRILIVDDDKDILSMLELAFLNTSYEVTTIDHPLQAYKMIENEHFDMVISDIQMPQMDGLTLLRKIKNFNGMIQVIMMTAHITINNTLDAFRYGAVDIFFKPFEDINEIILAADNVATKLNRVNSILHELAKGDK